MSQEIKEAWFRATSADPRIVRLLEAACALAEDGANTTTVYRDLQPYLAWLVGPDRGQSAPDGSKTLTPGAAAAFLPVISEPWDGPSDAAAYLGSERTLDACLDVIITAFYAVEEDRDRPE